jgi:hypothetical protein
MGKDNGIIHEGQVLMSVKVRRVVKTAEYENYEVVLDETHLCNEANVKNTRDRFIDAMTETIHAKVKAFEAKLAEEYKAEMDAERTAWLKEVEENNKARAARIASELEPPRPEEPIDAPVKTDAQNEAEAKTPDELDGDLAPPEDEEQARRDDE